MIETYRATGTYSTRATHKWFGGCAYRRKFLMRAMENSSKEIIGHLCQEHLADVEELEGLPDLVQRYGECRTQFGIYRFETLIKVRSSRVLIQEFPMLTRKMPTLRTYASRVGTAGGAKMCIVKHSIEQQKHV